MEDDFLESGGATGEFSEPRLTFAEEMGEESLCTRSFAAVWDSGVRGGDARWLTTSNVSAGDLMKLSGRAE